MAAPKRVFLLPGDIAFARSPARLSTLLGSCVAVCLYDRRRRYGGMNHFMLPTRQQTVTGLAAGKYGDYAIERLLSLAQRAGSRRGDLVASVYGGGRVSGHLGAAADLGLFDVGGRNVEHALRLLQQLGVPVLRRDVGGTRGRKIHMDSANNEIEVQLHGDSEENRERARKLESFRQRKIKVLVVDDSRMVRAILCESIERSADMTVVAEAADAYQARERILENDPDVLCLDIIMPRMDGLRFLKRVMRYRPIPTVIVSTVAKKGSDMRARAYKAGAVAVIDKDELHIYQGFERIDRHLLPKLRYAATTVARRQDGPGPSFESGSCAQ